MIKTWPFFWKDWVLAGVFEIWAFWRPGVWKAFRQPCSQTHRLNEIYLLGVIGRVFLNWLIEFWIEHKVDSNPRTRSETTALCSRCNSLRSEMPLSCIRAICLSLRSICSWIKLVTCRRAMSTSSLRILVAYWMLERIISLFLLRNWSRTNLGQVTVFH